MKSIKTDEKGHFICEECEKAIKNKASFGRHILSHGTKEIYLAKWLKEYKDGICKECGESTAILKLKYNNFCSKSCVMKNRHKLGYKERVFTKEITAKSMKTIIENKRKNPFLNKEIREKIKKTCLKKYGVDHPLKSKKIREKRSNTCLKILGCSEPFQSEKVKEKSKKTCLEKYGVEYAIQNSDVHKKQVKSAFYSGINIGIFQNIIYYQGSYELDFLEKYYDLFDEIVRGPSIKYIFKGENKIYFPDFFIKSINLIVEIKSSYTLRENMDRTKELYSKKLGYDFIMILDKNYEKFNKKYLNKNVIA